MVTAPIAVEELTPVTVSILPKPTLDEPTEELTETPVTVKGSTAIPIVPVPTLLETDTPVTVTVQFPVTVVEPTAPVEETPVGVWSTSDCLFQAFCPQEASPQALAIFYSYAILSIASEALAVGNCIVNVPEVAVLSPPKSKTATAGSPVAVSS